MTMGEQRPVHPAAMSTLAHTTTGPARWHATQVTAALLAFCAVVLVIVGSFLPLYSGVLSIGAENIEVTISPWSADVTGTIEPGDVPTIGYPLVFAAIVLACAAAMCWYAAVPATPPGVGRVSALTTVIGSAFLIGTVWTTALMVMNGVDSVLLIGTVAPGLETEATYLVGYWLLLVAALSSLVAAVLALIPVRQPTWAQINPDFVPRPYGVALPVQPVQPVRPTGPPQPAFQVDPLTGQPLPPSPPTGVPVAHQPFTGSAPPQPTTQPNAGPAVPLPPAVDVPPRQAPTAEPVPAQPVTPPVAGRPPGQEPGPAAEQRP
ncbi:hypothetical protein [Actinophytocola glycyrrhizae]|uniref:Uncharacterized protein n=1 Tax=Actinophytocola glycyrrhizae TaxID=2044873 RepID=A0ABV9RZW9_9PSEU